MKKNTFKAFPAVLMIASFCLCMAGCVQLERKYPDVRTYALDAGSHAHEDYAGTPVSVRINAFSATPQAADRSMAYRTGEMTYESDFYNQLVAAPAEMIRDQASAWLKGSPLLKFVFKSGQAAGPCYVLDGTLRDLYGDYRDPNAPRAVLRLELTVSESGDDSSGAVLQKIYSQEVSMDRVSPQELARGWNQGLSRIFADFENDLKSLVSETAA